MITLLQEYLAINTAHPHPDYKAVIALFKECAHTDGFLVTEFALPSGNSALVITLQGSSPELPALALNHHMDVVPADNAAQWKFPPFAGTVHEGLMYGRGTQDCKGVGVVQYGALKKLKQSGLSVARTIHCVLVPDEERGGFFGTKEFVAHPDFAALNIGYVLDEGMASGDDSVLLIKVDERTPLQIRVTSVGTQGHGSILLHHNCAHALINFLADVAALQVAQCHQQIEAGKLVSLQVTSLSTNNVALNVIPSQAQATIDVRIPSHMTLDAGVALLDALVRKHENLMYEVVATSQERFTAVDIDQPFYQTLAGAVAQQGLMPKPFAFEATTDARFYSHRGIQALGFTPFTVAANLHGTDESIRVTDLQQGTTILYNFLRAFCTNNNLKENS